MINFEEVSFFIVCDVDFKNIFDAGHSFARAFSVNTNILPE